jgi:3-phenylpropionate/trans-cinnamate dioxygenase ferredoxin reductase subunit
VSDALIVVGAGQAGGWVARTLRGEGYRGTIVMIGEEPHPPYERPPLSKAVLSGAAAPDETLLFKAEVFDELDLTWRRGERVAAIDRTARNVVLAHGELIRYEKLILCTGGRARWPSVAGADLSGVHALRTLEDSLAIARALETAKRLVVVGGGWIGLEVAATARKKGIAVTVVEARPRLCERTVPKLISDYLLALHEKNGTEVILGCGIVGFGRDPDEDLVVQLDDGRALRADLAVVGVGLIANDEIARAAGLACENGILVDEQCRTSDPAILAAGDVAIAPNRWIGRRIRLESWQNAQDQGVAAAKTAMGQDIHYDPLPWFWSDQYDITVQIYGLPSPDQRAVVRGEPASGSFVVFYLEDEYVKAAVGVNASRDLRMSRRLIEKQKSVRDSDLSDSTIALAKL